jgi:hypothetical protein
VEPCLLALSIDRPRGHPSAGWVSQQQRQAFPFDTAPRYLLRDRDGSYGSQVRQTLSSMGMDEVVLAHRSPWQSPYVERFIGSLRGECLHHIIVLNERHPHRILSAYLAYYHQARPHPLQERNAPDPREVEPPGMGAVVGEALVGGLHHRYRRVA